MASAQIPSPPLTEGFFSEVLALDSSEDELLQSPVKRPRAFEDESPMKQPQPLDERPTTPGGMRILARASSAAAQQQATMTAKQTATKATIGHGHLVSSVVRDWSDPLGEALHERLHMLGPQLRDIIMDTLCSGADTEAYSLRKAALLDFVHRVAVECESFPDEFLTAQNEPKSACWFGCVREYASTSTTATWCRRHGANHPRPTELADLLAAGIVCRPYSQQRNKRFRSQSVEEHQDFDIADHVLEHVRRSRPRLVMIENVGGWDKLSREERAQDCESYMEKFIADLRAIGYEVRSITLDTKTWSNVRRPRIYVLATIRTASSAAAMDDVVSLIGHCVAERAKTPPRQVELRKTHDQRGHKRTRAESLSCRY